MGTRNLTMVVSGGQTKVAQYGQWDGYPSGQGATALGILSEIAKDNGWDKFREKVNSLRWFTEDEIKLLNEDYDGTESKYPYLSRDWATLILEAIYKGTLTNHSSYPVDKTTVIKTNVTALISSEQFGGDSLFCEWAYVIDLDKMTFEVYKGFNDTTPLTEGDRFFKAQEDYNLTRIANGRDANYYGCTLVKSYDLNNLPDVSTLCKECEPRDEEDVEDDLATTDTNTTN